MQKPFLARDVEEGAGRSLCLAVVCYIFYPFPFLQRRAHFTAKLFSWFLSTNKTTFVLGRREGKRYEWNCWCRIFLSFFPPAESCQDSSSLSQGVGWQSQQSKSQNWAGFSGPDKKEKSWDPSKAIRVSFVGLKAERRLTRDYNFKSFFYFTGLVSSCCVTGFASSFNWWHSWAVATGVFLGLVSNGNRAFFTTVPLCTCIPVLLLNPMAMFN